MNTTISRPLLTELTEVFEDTASLACDEYMISGQLLWTVVQSLAESKLNEFEHS